MSQRLVQRVLWVVLAGLVAAVVVVAVQRSSARPDASGTDASASSKFDGGMMPADLRAGGFTLSDWTGRRVSLSQYRGHVVVLTFIHSLCHDTCPLMVETIKGALNELPGNGAGVPAIGITAAPAEDTVANRRSFLAKHEMLGRLAFLNGPLAALKQVWHAYAVQPVTPTIDHSTFVILIDKRGYERVGFAADQLTPEGVAHDIAALQREPA